MWKCTLLHALGMVRVVGGDMCVCGRGVCLKEWDIMSVQDSHTHTDTLVNTDDNNSESESRGRRCWMV